MSTVGSPPSIPITTTTTATFDVKPPTQRRPSLIMKPASSLSATSPPPTAAGTVSLTSKEWVVPPRPKPGRKPATDTPPTKRKAQNREAQRAFRERRAQRVSELEDQMKGMQDDYDNEQDIMRTRIHQLEMSIAQYRAELVSWTDRCRKLEHENDTLRPGNRTDTLSHEESNEQVGCGKCTLETRCQCIDEAFTAMSGQEVDTEKRPHSPVQRRAEKRIKIEPSDNPEIDFTAMYSKQKSRTSQDHVSPSSAVADPCGFCSDGTPCICAEMAAEQNQPQTSNRPAPSILSNVPTHLAQFTPPPSDGDVSQASATVDPCANGPGTCAQCRADPNSTLFCKSLAASRTQSRVQGCCGGQTSTGSCCQTSTAAVPLPKRATRSSNTADATPPSRQKDHVMLTCADAYTTLSRHPAYERASGEIASWMPKLHASDPAMKEALEERPAMEIDAANVMTVLKDFDRRFGRDV